MNPTCKEGHSGATNPSTTQRKRGNSFEPCVTMLETIFNIPFYSCHSAIFLIKVLFKTNSESIKLVKLTQIQEDQPITAGMLNSPHMLTSRFSKPGFKRVGRMEPICDRKLVLRTNFVGLFVVFMFITAMLNNQLSGKLFKREYK